MVDPEKLINKKINPQWKRPQGSPLVLCFKKESSQDVDTLYEMLVSEGFHSVQKPWDAFWSQRYASVMGPDGYQVDIFSDL